MDNSIARSDLQPLMDIVEANGRIVDSLSDEIVNKYCTEFDAYINEIRTEISRNVNTLDDDKLNSYIIMLPLYCINLGPVMESVGIKEDISKSLKQAQFNTFYDETTGTVAHRTAKSELFASKENLVLSIYQRAYKKMRYKLDYAEELMQSVKKVIGNKMQDKQIQLQETYQPIVNTFPRSN